jgi:uncharacterized protein (DUF1778 family)
MHTATLELARTELKTTFEAKELLNQAATLDGMDLSAFVLGSAIEKARKVLADHSVISLTRDGQAMLAQWLASPPAPSAAMKELMSLADLPQRQT